MESSSTTACTKSGGTIATVTGASGFIGSYVCQNLLEHGYTVRACVRSMVPSKVDHLHNMARSAIVQEAGGRLELCVADMSQPGAYDEIFGNGCEVVFHVAGNFGTDYHLWKSKHNTNNNSDSDSDSDNPNKNFKKGRLPPIDSLMNELNSGNGKPTIKPTADYSYDHAVYQSYVTAMEWILDSVSKHACTIRKVVYTSSGAAGATVTGPFMISDESDILDNAYGRAKHDCEAMLYDFCNNNDMVGVSVCPCIVLGPLMGPPPLHDTVYQHRLSDMLRGRYTLDQCWEITDVRDVAETHRLAAESETVVNGTRFWNGHDPGWDVSDLLSYLANHEDFRDDAVIVPIVQNNDDSSSCSEREDSNDNGGDDGSEECSSSSSSSGSSSSEDSYGVSEWDDDDKHTTTWSDPIAAFDGYTPRTPRQTALETTDSIRQRWTGLGRILTLKECYDYYTVAEMDGCDEEMEWLANEIRSMLARANKNC